MVHLKVYNQHGNVSGEIEGPSFLSEPLNLELIHQIFKSYAANRRTSTAHTKNRGEVRGGGVKPWRQKGTGRARHGSSRSPIWRHGGVVFGPRNTTDFSQKINVKMAKKALAGVLAQKVKAEQLKIVDSFTDKQKTKDIVSVISNLAGNKSSLLVISVGENNAFRAAANLPLVKVLKIKDLNVYEALTHKFIIFDKKAFEELPR